MKDPRAYTEFIIDRLRVLEKILANGMDKAFTDETSALAIERIMETVADATKKIPLDFKDKYPDIPWTKIASFRNTMAHEYMGVSYTDLREIITDHIPPLHKAVREINEVLKQNG